MYPIRDPKNVERELIFASENYRVLDAKHSWVTGDPLKPLTTALTHAGAVQVDVKEFRTSGANFWSGRPLVTRDFQVWEMPGRQARVRNERHEWRLGVRLGATASEERSKRMYDLSSASPRIRKAALREVTDVLRYR